MQQMGIETRLVKIKNRLLKVLQEIETGNDNQMQTDCEITTSIV
jgi:hypothetical protein